jgi:alcohol dehydrogenase class IV
LSTDPVSFTWDDAGRTVHFGAGALEKAPEAEIELFTTPRALADAERIGASAAVHEVAPGGVPEAAGALLDRASAPTIVALGGGRVIDTAKAVAAIEGQRVVAIPTTLSGAEMTGVHRLPAGREEDAQHLVRPSFVIADPSEMTTLDDRRLRASAMNALAHGAEALYVPFANPVSTLAALRGAELIANALDQEPGERDRPGLALGALLSAYALDTTGFALHHVVCQTLVRMLGTPHAETNAAMIPRTMEAMRTRAPDEMTSLAHALGAEPDEIRLRLESLGGGPRRLRDLGGNPDRLESARHAMLQRTELANTPDPPGPEELRRLLEDAW